MLSVVCPIYNEEKYIGRCIESILAQNYPHDSLEVLFVDGMSNDRTRDIVAEYSKCYPFIHLLDNAHKIVPYAMNIGIEAAKGDIIIRLDAHAEYPTNYFSVLTHKLIELEADNVGVVCKTDVLNKNPKTLAIKEVLSNKFGVGNSAFRTGISQTMEVDTVPFGCWKKEVFKKYGKYDIRLIRNQDIELNKRIHHGGGKIYIVPDSYCTYLARETFNGIWKNNFANGKWNILTVFYTKDFKSLSIRHFIPLLFVLSIITPFILSIFYIHFIYISLLSITAYLSLITFESIRVNIKNKTKIHLLLLSFIILHFSYGLGSLCAIFKLPFLR